MILWQTDVRECFLLSQKLPAATLRNNEILKKTLKSESLYGLCLECLFLFISKSHP